MVQNLYKNWLLVLKIIWGIWITSDKQCKVQKVEIQWATFVQKYIPSAKSLYTEDLSNITFNYLRENSSNSLCHFWSHKSFFTTQLLCIIFAQKLYSFNTNILSKSNFSDFSLLELRFIKFLISCHFWNKKLVFLLSFDHSSMLWEITLLHFFSWNFKCYWKK